MAQVEMAFRSTEAISDDHHQGRYFTSYMSGKPTSHVHHVHREIEDIISISRWSTVENGAVG